MAKKKKKAKSKVKRRKRGHGKSTAKRASTAKRGAKRVTLTVAQLRALTKGKKSKGGKRKKSSSNHPAGRFAVGMSATERKLEADVRREEAKLDAAIEKRRKEDEREAAKAKKEREEEEKFAKSRAELAELRAERENRAARREAEWENKIADHKARVAAAREELRAEASYGGGSLGGVSPSIGGRAGFSSGFGRARTG